MILMINKILSSVLEILLFDADDNPTVIDPLFEYWVKKYYFEMKD